MSLATVDHAIETIGRGEFVLVVDDEARENEGDLVLAAEWATPEKIAFMVKHTSGVICVPTTGERLDDLGLQLMVLENTDSHKTAFTVSVDYRHGTTTGISAADRTATIQAIVDPRTLPTDLARPGHVFPLQARSGGVLVRPGHTEAAVDLARLAGLAPAGVLCEAVNDDGTMARGAELQRFAKEHGIPLITIEDLIAYRWREESILNREVEANLPTRFGDFTVVGYRSSIDGTEQIALVRGDVVGETCVLTRIHSECLTGDTFGSLRCDCQDQLYGAMQLIAEEDRGVLIYNQGHEGRGIGLIGKLKAYRLQDQGRDTVEANLDLGFAIDARHYGVAAQILNDLKVSSVRLLTNNPKKLEQLELLGVNVAERTSHVIANSEIARSYLRTKAAKLGHLLDDDDR